MVLRNLWGHGYHPSPFLSSEGPGFHSARYLYLALASCHPSGRRYCNSSRPYDILWIFTSLPGGPLAGLARWSAALGVAFLSYIRLRRVYGPSSTGFLIDPTRPDRVVFLSSIRLRRMFGPVRPSQIPPCWHGWYFDPSFIPIRSFRNGIPSQIPPGESLLSGGSVRNCPRKRRVLEHLRHPFLYLQVLWERCAARKIRLAPRTWIHRRCSSLLPPIRQPFLPVFLHC